MQRYGENISSLAVMKHLPSQENRKMLSPPFALLFPQKMSSNFLYSVFFFRETVSGYTNVIQIT